MTLEVTSQAVPTFGTALRIAPVGDAHRTDMPAGCPSAERRGEIDDAPVPEQRRLAPPLVGVHEQVERVRRQTGEGRMRPEPVGIERSAMALDRITAPRECLDALDEVERKLHEVEPEVVANHRRPVRGAGPALEREAGVDAQADLHASSPGCAWERRSPAAGIAARLCSVVEATICR